MISIFANLLMPTIPTYNVSAQPIVPIPLPVYMTCIFVQHGPVEIGFTALCIVYGTEPSPVPHQRDTHSDYPTDFLAFSIIIYVVFDSLLYH